MPFLTQISTQAAQYQHSQAEVVALFKGIMSLDEDRRARLLFHFIQKNSPVVTRSSCLPMSLFRGPADDPDNLSQAPIGLLSTGERQQLYEENAPWLQEQLVKQHGQVKQPINNLITVSCTGYSTPGLDFNLRRYLPSKPDPFRYNVGAMGCYAGIVGLRLAAQLPGESWLNCLELCSLHFQREPNTFSILASNSLFADGAALVTVSAEPATIPGTAGLCFELIDFGTAQIPDSLDEMSWYIRDRGYQMYLSESVPRLIGEQLASLCNPWLAQHQLTPTEIDHWAIHPGSKTILEAVTHSLALDPEPTLKHSLAVLSRHGNMSSPTVFFILKELIEHEALQPGQKVVLLAFGPGLTAEAALLKVVAA